MTSGSGHRLYFLPGLNSELQEVGASNKLTLANLDQAILESATSRPHDKPLMHYLLPCWKRAVRTMSLAKVTTGLRFEVYGEAKRLALSHCLFSLSLSDLYG